MALAEESGLAAASADLVTVAQAAHWLDLPRFYEEVRRVARADAILALVTYGVLHVDGPMEPLVQHFYHQVVGPYWPAERRHVRRATAICRSPSRSAACRTWPSRWPGPWTNCWAMSVPGRR